jgi:hypothetical protein
MLPIKYSRPDGDHRTRDDVAEAVADEDLAAFKTAVERDGLCYTSLPGVKGTRERKRHLRVEESLRGGPGVTEPPSDNRTDATLTG